MAVLVFRTNLFTCSYVDVSHKSHLPAIFQIRDREMAEILSLQKQILFWIGHFVFVLSLLLPNLNGALQAKGCGDLPACIYSHFFSFLFLSLSVLVYILSLSLELSKA